MKGGSKAVRGMHQSQRSTHTINDTKDVHSVVHPYDEGENSQTHILSSLWIEYNRAAFYSIYSPLENLAFYPFIRSNFLAKKIECMHSIRSCISTQ